MSPSVGQIPTCYSPVRHSSAPRSSRRNPSGPLPFDLHVLGLPPAFNLSQDQTLQFKIVSIGQSKTLSSGVPLFYPDLHPDKIKTRYCCSELDAKAPTQSACKLLKIKAHPRKRLPEEVRIIQISYRLSNLFWCFLHLFQQARFNHCQPQPTSLKKHS